MKKNNFYRTLNPKNSYYNFYKKEKINQEFNSLTVQTTAIEKNKFLISNKPYRNSFKTYNSVNSTSSNNSKLLNLNTQKTYYWNQCFDKGRLKNFVLWFFRNNGEHKTIQLVEEFKTLGFQYATKAGISLGIEDLKIPPKKALLIYSAEKETASTIKQYKRGDITGVERFQRLIDTWHRTSEQLKQEVIDNFEATDILNPVYMMAFSGARGNISQVRQLVGMRGLMSNPQGQIIDFPIRSNFREGLTLTEYIISSYGARKGIVDTALRTANAGYLTRRLVDVAQHVIISNFDCGTRRGIFLKDMKEGNKTIVSLNTRLIGRVCGTDIYSNSELNFHKENRDLIAKRNQEISIDLAFEISKVSKKVFVRSALTCETKKLVCQLCYGWSLAQGNLVSIGEAIGVIAAQSIGEPGTQLTMRTFHTGGVFSGDVSDQIRMPFSGMIIYNAPIAGTLIRTPEGKIAFLTKAEGSFTICQISEGTEETLILKQLLETTDIGFTSSKLTSILPKGIQTKKFKIPAYTLLYAKNGDLFTEKEVVAQISSISKQKNATDEAELTIKSEIDGQLHINYLELKENKVGPKLTKKEKEQEDSLEIFEKTLLPNLNHLTNLSKETQTNQFLVQKNGPTNLLESYFETWKWGNAWILSGKIYHSPTPSRFFPEIGDYINMTSLMNGPNNFKFISLVSGDSKLEFLSNLEPKYNRPKKGKKFKTSYEILLNNSSKNVSNFNELNIHGKKNMFPTLNKELLNFSVNYLKYQTIGYYINLNKSIKYKILKSFIKPKNLSLKNLEMKKFLIKTNFLSSNDSIFIIPENFQVLLNNSLVRLYPSNWQPDSKTIVQWFPSELNLSTPGIIAKEEINQIKSHIFAKKKNYKFQKFLNKHESFLFCDQSFLVQTGKLTNKEKSEISLKILCLGKDSSLSNLKIKTIKTTIFNKKNEMNGNQTKSSGFSASTLNYNSHLKLKETYTLEELTEYNFSRLFFVPTIKNEMILDQRRKTNFSNTNLALNSKSKKQKLVNMIQEGLKLKLKTKRTSLITCSILRKEKNSKKSPPPQITNLKSFCFIYSNLLKKNKKPISLSPKKSINLYEKQSNVWVYFIPKTANPKFALSSHTKYLLYPGQFSPFEVCFENQLTAVFKGSIQNKNTISTNFIQLHGKKFNLKNWVENKKCRYDISTKSLLAFPGQLNNFQGPSKVIIENQANLNNYNIFLFQKVQELNFNSRKNGNKINLKNEIYELSKNSENPLNTLYKITLSSNNQIDNLTHSFESKIVPISKKLKFRNRKILGSLQVFTNLKEKLEQNKQKKAINKQKAITKLNHLFSISPDFDSCLSPISESQTIATKAWNLFSDLIPTKSNTKLIKKSLFNTSYLSSTQYQQFKNPLLNKQESMFQILSKYPNIDIDILSETPKNLKFNNFIFGSKTDAISPVDQKVKNEMKTQLTYGFISKAINLFPFYITLDLEQEKRKVSGIKNINKNTLFQEKSGDKLFDYPFKDYKISFEQNSGNYLSKISKNYLTQILFPQPFLKNSTNFNFLNEKNGVHNNIIHLENKQNNLNFPIRGVTDFENLLKLPKFRSMIGYSLEEVFNSYQNKTKVNSSTFLQPKNQSLSTIKFYGGSNYKISHLVPFAQSFSYSPFEGEIIKITSPYLLGTKQKNSLKENLYLENKTISLQQKQHVSIFLTKQDLISYNFQKSKTKNTTQSINQSQSFSETIKLQNQLKNYLIKDIILPISSDNLSNINDKQNTTEISFENGINNPPVKMIYQIPDIVGGFPLSKSTQNKVRKSEMFNSDKNLKKLGSNLKSSDQKQNNLIRGKDLKLSNSNVYQIGDFIVFGDKISPPNLTNEDGLQNNYAVSISGQIIHINKTKLTIRKGQPLFISPKSILHKLDGDFIESKSPVITLSYQRLKTGDIVQGIPKIEQFFEARTTKRGRLFRDSLPNLLKALFKRYLEQMPLEKAVRQSFYKIQQIIVDGVLRVYRSQGVTISDKHLEIIVKQMTAKVRILEGGQTGFFPGEVVDLDFVEQVNELLMKKIQYEPLVLGITKSSLEVDSFLSAASFQQTTRVLSQSAIARKKDFLKGLKENVILGNLIPAGTGYLVYLEDQSSNLKNNF